MPLLKPHGRANINNNGWNGSLHIAPKVTKNVSIKLELIGAGDFNGNVHMTPQIGIQLIGAGLPF